MKRILVVIAVLLSACGPVQGPRSHGGPVKDQVSLIDALRSKGLTVDISGKVYEPFLSAQSGTSLHLTGAALSAPADLQVFEYGSAEAATADAHQIRPDGSGTATMMVDWVAPPHFFLKERVLVIYLGKAGGLVSVLSDLLGPQFAGS